MPITKCDSLDTLKAELDAVRKQVTLDETEDTWDTIAQGILRLSHLCNIGACDFPSELVIGIRSIAKALNASLNSERSRLSGAAIELVTALAAGLGSSFEPLVPCLVPTLLVLCGRTNKVFTSRARACILAIIDHTRLPSLLLHLCGLANNKSVLPRLIAAEGVLACLNCFNPPDLEKESRARAVEEFIKLTARDASADVRKTSKEVFKAYKTLMPARVDSFVAPLTPVVKKYLDIQPGFHSSLGASSSAGQKQTSRPSSRANNKIMEPAQRPGSAALPKPLTRPATDNMTNTQYRPRPVAPNPPAAVDVRGPRQRTMSQMQRDPPQARNLPKVQAPSTNPAQPNALPTTSVPRQAVQRPPPGVARIMPTRNPSSTGGPQRPPPMQIKFEAPADRFKTSGSGAKRVPLPAVPTNDHVSEVLPSAAAPADRATATAGQPPSKLPSRSVELPAPRKLVISRKAPETTRSAPSAKTANGSGSTGSGTAQRFHKPSAKDETTKTAPQRRPAGNMQKDTRPLVKAERKETSPTLIPLPPSPSARPTEIPLPPSPDCTPRPADAETRDKLVAEILSEPTDLAAPTISTESCQEQATTGSPTTPITSLLSSIQRGFLFTPTSPLSPPQNYLATAGNFPKKIIVNEFTNAPLVAAPFCIPPEDGLGADNIDRHALRDLN